MIVKLFYLDFPHDAMLPSNVSTAFEFFTVCAKLAEMAILCSKDVTTAKKVTSSGGSI